MATTFIAGPCVIESMELLETVAQELVRINQELGTDIIYPLFPWTRHRKRLADAQRYQGEVRLTCTH